MGGEGAAQGPFVLAVLLGAVLAALAYIGGPLFFAFGLSFLPLTFSLVALAVSSYLLATKYQDPTGITLYGKYGETVAGFALWGFMATACLLLAQYAFFRHWPGMGDHGILDKKPLMEFILNRNCIDKPGFDVCTGAMCIATRTGDKAFVESFCSIEGNQDQEYCGENNRIFDWAMANCMGTCGCKADMDPFNPISRTAAEDQGFECVKTGTCGAFLQSTSVNWVYGKYPFFIELHIATGVFLELFVPLQFLKRVRMWKNKAFHRWNGRIMALLVIPNQIGSGGMALLGIFDPAVAVHAYTFWMRFYFSFAIIFTLTFVARAVYAVKVQKDIPTHGEYMMRAMAIWFAIPFFRMSIPFFAFFVGMRRAFSWSAGAALVAPLSLAEIYIRYSERFVTPAWFEDMGARSELNKVESQS